VLYCTVPPHAVIQRRATQLIPTRWYAYNAFSIQSKKQPLNVWTYTPKPIQKNAFDKGRRGRGDRDFNFSDRLLLSLGSSHFASRDGQHRLEYFEINASGD